MQPTDLKGTVVGCFFMLEVSDLDFVKKALRMFKPLVAVDSRPTSPHLPQLFAL